MRNLQSLLKLAVVCLAVLLTAGPTVDAQESDALRFFQTNPSRSIVRQAPARPIRGAVSVRGRNGTENSDFVAPQRLLQRSLSRNPSYRIARPSPEPEKPVVPASIFIHVVGDSLSELLAQGLKETLAEKPEIGVLKLSNSSSGIVRDDYFSWGKALRDLTGSPAKIDLIVMMIGSNDRQPLRDEAGSHEFRSEQWREIYTKRLDDIMSIVREKRLPLVWVGLPVMQSQRLSADILYLNGLFRERATRNNVAYVDSWDGFVNDQGQYASIGPDVNGTIVKLRTVDGVHFTKAGSRKLAFFVNRETENQLTRQRAGTDIAALPSELSEQIRRSAPAVIPNSAAVLEQKSVQEAILLPEDTLKAAVIGERPLTGPILILTQPAQTEGSRLLKARVTPPMNEINLLTEQVMGYGRLPVPKTGRSDDFRWLPAQTAETSRRVN
jgi:uncharacterized protein